MYMSIDYNLCGTRQVRLLVEEGGADMGLRDRWGNTALDEAMRVNATPCILYLKSKGAKTNTFAFPPAAGASA